MSGKSFVSNLNLASVWSFLFAEFVIYEALAFIPWLVGTFCCMKDDPHIVSLTSNEHKPINTWQLL
jgi:hypothetical protein